MGAQKSKHSYGRASKKQDTADALKRALLLSERAIQALSASKYRLAKISDNPERTNGEDGLYRICCQINTAQSELISLSRMLKEFARAETSKLKDE